MRKTHHRHWSQGKDLQRDVDHVIRIIHTCKLDSMFLRQTAVPRPLLGATSEVFAQCSLSMYVSLSEIHIFSEFKWKIRSCLTPKTMLLSTSIGSPGGTPSHRPRESNELDHLLSIIQSSSLFLIKFLAEHGRSHYTFSNSMILGIAHDQAAGDLKH